jgi:predicted DNA-binding protein
MAMATIPLSEQQQSALQTIDRQTGKSQDELLRDAVEEYIG